jgi:hypothetical protein
MRPSILLTAICQLSCLAIRPALAAEAGSSSVMEIDNTRVELVSKYLKSAQIRQATLRGVQIEVDIKAELPKLEKAGTLRALRQISCTGQVTYKVLDSSGDVSVKREIINRYLAAESEAHDTDSIAITPANYEFRRKSTPGPERQSVQIFWLKPKRKRVGLFKGELWLDAETGMPLREAGQFVKVPSIFLKRIRFVRDYEIRDGVSVPISIETTVETRLMGRADLSVHFHNFTNEDGDDCHSREPAVLYRGAHEKANEPKGATAFAETEFHRRKGEQR